MRIRTNKLAATALATALAFGVAACEGEVGEEGDGGIIEGEVGEGEVGEGEGEVLEEED